MGFTPFIYNTLRGDGILGEKATQRWKIKENRSDWLNEIAVIARREGKLSEEFSNSYCVLQIKNGELVSEVKGLLPDCCFMTTCTKTKL